LIRHALSFSAPLEVKNECRELSVSGSSPVLISRRVLKVFGD